MKKKQKKTLETKNYFTIMSHVKIYHSRENQPAVQVTPAALAHFKKTLPKDILGVRLSVKEAGCSGLKYVLMPAQAQQADDEMFTAADNFSVFIPRKDFPYLYGIKIDCVTEGINKVIKFINPNEKSSCGCGESFSV